MKCLYLISAAALMVFSAACDPEENLSQTTPAASEQDGGVTTKADVGEETPPPAATVPDAQPPAQPPAVLDAGLPADQAGMDGPQSALWLDDNRGQRAAPRRDAVTIRAKKIDDQSIGLTLEVSAQADYLRLCDGAVFFSAKDKWDSWLVQRTLPFSGILLRPYTDFARTVTIKSSELGRNGPFVLVKGSVRLETSCLRWVGQGLPDLATIPGDQPSQHPRQLCDPAQEKCGNTCLASPQDPTACLDTQQRWPGASGN